MKKQFISASLCIAIALLACNTKEKSTDSSSIENSTVTDASVSSDSSAEIVQPVNNMVMSDSAAAVPANASSPVVKTAPGMNPPHGEPGHICEIAVGAPLSSAPQKMGTVKPTEVTPVQPVSAPSAVTAPGMNPPHGQPGHDCNIAVGAPLK